MTFVGEKRERQSPADALAKARQDKKAGSVGAGAQVPASRPRILACRDLAADENAGAGEGPPSVIWPV
jgi:hypothetical protein